MPDKPLCRRSFCCPAVYGIGNGLDKTHCSNWLCLESQCFHTGFTPRCWEFDCPAVSGRRVLGGMGGGDIKLMAACGLVLGC